MIQRTQCHANRSSLRVSSLLPKSAKRTPHITSSYVCRSSYHHIVLVGKMCVCACAGWVALCFDIRVLYVRRRSFESAIGATLVSNESVPAVIGWLPRRVLRFWYCQTRVSRSHSGLVLVSAPPPCVCVSVSVSTSTSAFGNS